MLPCRFTYPGRWICTLQFTIAQGALPGVSYPSQPPLGSTAASYIYMHFVLPGPRYTAYLHMSEGYLASASSCRAGRSNTFKSTGIPRCTSNGPNSLLSKPLPLI